MFKEKNPPLKIENCFHCPRIVKVKYVRASGDYSSKNNWGYWTENAEDKKFYLCDDCLVKLYKNCKWEFQKCILNKEKQTLLRQYILSGVIKGRLKREFVTKNLGEISKKKKKNS